MSVKIRLSRGGAKKRPYYYVVVAHGSSPRDGRYIEQIGTFDPMLKKDDPNRVKLKEDRVKHWLWRRRAADGSRPPPARRRGPRQAHAIQQSGKGKAEEEGPGTRRRRSREGRQGGRSHSACRRCISKLVFEQLILLSLPGATREALCCRSHWPEIWSR